MPDPLVVPASGSKDVATLAIKVDGAAVPQTFHVAALAIHRAVGKLPSARIDFFDGDPAGQTFAASTDGLFVPGKEIEIAAGWRSQDTVLFRGVIIGQRLRIRQQGAGRLTVQARHPLFKAALYPRARASADKSDDAIMKGVFREHGVTLRVQAPGLPVHETLVQSGQSDWAFACQRADALGLWLIADDAGASLAPLAASEDPVLSLRYGATILELDAELDARSQPDSVEFQSWDPAVQEVASVTASEPSLPMAGDLAASMLGGVHGQKMTLVHSGASAVDQAAAAAAGRLVRSRLRRICGRVRCEGTPAPLPGKILELGGLGGRFNGRHAISGVRHEINGGRWITDVEFGRPMDPLWSSSENLAEAGGPSSSKAGGLMIGKVLAIAGDPAAELRVQVELPVLGQGSAPLWARLAQPDAGPDRGMFYYPEAGDEVVVGFLAGDAGFPVVLGALHSSAQPAPLTPEAANPKKGYVSREKISLLMDDAEKSLLLETPGGNSFLLSDAASGLTLADQNGNKIVFEPAGITIESAGELKLKSAAGGVVDAGATLELTAAATLTASGSAGAEFSSSGMTSLKGATVHIN